MIKPEECKERIVGDLNCDCQLSPYETCLLGGNSQEVCDCVKTGGNINTCVSEIIEKQIDDSQLDPCVKGIIEQLKNLQQNDFVKILAKLGNPNSTYKVDIIPDNNLGEDEYGVTDWSAPIGYPIIPYEYTIKLNNQFLQSSTKLGIASTIIHELIHAYFLSLVDDYDQTGNSSLNSFPVLWNYYVNNFTGEGASIAHHNTMALIYINTIARALQEFQTGNPVPDSVEPLQIYKDLAWGGLDNTPPYNSLSNSDKSRIIAVNNAENFGTQQNSNGNNYSPISIPCN